MSSTDQINLFLKKINECSNTIATAYYQGRIYKTDDNVRDIEKLKQMRLLSPDIREAFQLRAYFRQFLDTALNADRLFSIGANIGDYFKRLEELINEHSIAFQESRDTDCERYEAEIREAISDIADEIDDELLRLRVQVANRFAAVTTIAEKKRQNAHYLQRTEHLVVEV